MDTADTKKRGDSKEKALKKSNFSAFLCPNDLQYWILCYINGIVDNRCYLFEVTTITKQNDSDSEIKAILK